MTTTVASLEAVFTANTTNLTSGLHKADTAITGFGKKLESIGGNLTSLGSQMGALSAPAVGMFGAAINSAMGFDEAMTNANSILQLSGEEIGAISDEILAMGTNSLAGPQALAEAFYEITSGVADTSTHMDILTTSIAVSEAGASTLIGTTAALVGTMNAYGFAAEDAAFAGDVLTRAVGLGVFSMDELAAALPNVTGLAASSGVAFDELAAATALISTQGFSASQATTQLAGVMTAIVKPNEKMIAALEELGYTAADAKYLLAEHGLAGSMELINSTSAVAEDGLAAVLGTTEALNGATSLLSDNADSFFKDFSGGTIELRNAVSDLTMVTDEFMSGNANWNDRINPALLTSMAEELDYATEATEGYTEAARKIQRASPAAQFKLMKAQVSGLAIEVGTALLPAMVDLFDTVKPFLTELVGWVRENPRLISQIAMVAFGVAALATVLIPLGMAISAVGTLFTIAGAALGLLLSPIGLVIVALGLLAYAYTQNFLGIKDALAPALEWLQGAFSSAVEWMGNLVNAFKEGGLSGAADFIVEQITALANSIINTDWGAVWTNIKTKASELWENFKTGLALTTDFILSNIVTPLMVNIAATDWGGAWAQITQMAGMLWENFKLGLVVAADFILVNIVNPLAEQVSTFVSSGGLYDAVYGLGLAMWNGLLLGIQSYSAIATFIQDNIIAPLTTQALTFLNGGMLWDAIQSLGPNAWEGLKAGFALYAGINSFIYDNLVAPLIQSAADSDWSGVVNNAITKAEAIVTGVRDTLVGAASGIWADFRQAMNDLIPNSIPFNTTVTVLGVTKTIGTSFNLPDNPFAQGTPWTGNMGIGTPAGIVHGQEAVIPHNGMMAKVMPSPGGLMVQGGGRGGGGIHIDTLIVNGVQDIQSLYRQIEKEAQRQSFAGGVW